MKIREIFSKGEVIPFPTGRVSNNVTPSPTGPVSNNVTPFPAVPVSREKIRNSYLKIIKKYLYNGLNKISFKQSSNGQVVAINNETGFNNVFDLLSQIKLEKEKIPKKKSPRSSVITQIDIDWLSQFKKSNPTFYKKLITYAYPKKLGEVLNLLDDFSEELQEFQEKFKDHKQDYAAALEGMSVLPHEMISTIRRMMLTIRSLKRQIKEEEDDNKQNLKISEGEVVQFPITSNNWQRLANEIFIEFEEFKKFLNDKGIPHNNLEEIKTWILNNKDTISYGRLLEKKPEIQKLYQRSADLISKAVNLINNPMIDTQDSEKLKSQILMLGLNNGFIYNGILSPTKYLASEPS